MPVEKVSSPLGAPHRAGRTYDRVPVARLASGGDVSLGLHVVSGKRDGPTLGIVTTIHGDETTPLMAVRDLLSCLENEEFAGRVAAIPVANPLAVAVFGRQTPEQHGRTDLHEVFPGQPRGNVTQRLAYAITQHLLDHVDALVDIHAGGTGGRLQNRADFNAAATGNVHERSLALCRAFNAPFVHENNLAGTAAAYCNQRGVPTANPEVGGVYLGPVAESQYHEDCVSGLRGIMAELSMLDQAPSTLRRQLLFGVDGRFESNPSVGGFLRSFFDTPAHLGQRIEKGQALGEMVDLHTLQVLEELRAPVAGHLFFSRYSGVVDAGTKAFALADEATARWL